MALKDLEIRGAGDILGAEQSGNVASVGFDLYCQMLNEAVAELRGEKAPAERYDPRTTGVRLIGNPYKQQRKKKGRRNG